MTMQHEAEVLTRNSWQLDPNHTQVGFSVKHMMVTTVKGFFKNIRGTIILDEADPSRSSVDVEIDTTSLYSGSEMRDNHVKSAEFLDIENHPLITFKSTRVEPQGLDHARVIGDLTIKGVTREVALETELTGRGKVPGGAAIIGFDAWTQIARSDFGVTMNMALETGGVFVSEVVKIEISAQAHQLSV
ncbi:MAG TPA: YceI family protein [Ktedonobacteraceae bacterium]